jgi:hypothetical protein
MINLDAASLVPTLIIRRWGRMVRRSPWEPVLGIYPYWLRDCFFACAHSLSHS